jgi:hypothetical protein
MPKQKESINANWKPKRCEDKPQAKQIHKINHGPILGGITILFP